MLSAHLYPAVAGFPTASAVDSALRESPDSTELDTAYIT